LSTTALLENSFIEIGIGIAIEIAIEIGIDSIVYQVFPDDIASLSQAAQNLAAI
jgi:3-deoxy-D-arabino-heptulosonate 7-phosphate (DAHP) synthase